MCVWLLAPIVIVVILAFSGDGYLRFPPTALSLQWFDRFFGNLQWQRALLSSLIIGAIACIVSTTIGFFSAYAFLRTDFRGKKLLLSLMLTPAIVPSIITAIAMYYFAGRLGLIGNYLPDYALSSAIKAWYKTGTYGCFCGFERWRATRCNFKRGSARPSLLFFTAQRISAGRR